MIRAKYLSFFLFLALLLAACGQNSPAPAATPTPIPPPMPGTLHVVPEAALGAISPYLLGSNYGPWVSVAPAMLPAAYESGVTIIRFPGGAWGDRNNLRPYHIDYFMDFVAQVGAKASISARLREATPEQAAELVRYVNIEKGYGVEYWSIGNEPTLFAAELQTVGRADDYDTVQFNREWREFAEAMKAMDPTIKLVGPEVHQFTDNPNLNPKDSAGRDWMIEFLKANGDMVDVVTFHRYPFPSGNFSVTVEDLRAHTREWARTLPYLRGLIQEHTGRDIPIAITEVNTHWNQAIGGEATPDSHYGAIWLAEMLGQLMRQDVFMVNHWMLTSQGGQGGWGLIGRSELRPSYYVFQLFKQFGEERAYAESGVADVSVYAAKRADGVLTVLVVNLADEAQTVALQVEGMGLGTAVIQQLTPEQNPEAAPFTFPADGAITLPPQSVTLFEIGE